MKSSASPISQSLYSVRTEPHNQAAIAAVFLTSALFGAFVSWRSGQDYNWDWQNYHDYAVWALFKKRLWIDVAPAWIQSYLNPIPLIPDYLARNFLPMPVGAVLMGAVQGTALAFAALIGARLVGVALAFVATAIAACGPLTLSEIGTSMPDLLTAIPILAGLYLLIFSPVGERRLILWAGILIGAAAGAKLSNGPYLIAAGIAALVGPGRQHRVLWLVIGGAIGGFASAGPWAIVMWREFDNPLFPFYNAIFRAPEAVLVNIADRRFIPANVAEWLSYPFRWLIGQHPTSEAMFRDARFAVLALLWPLAVAGRLGRRAPIFSVQDLRFFTFIAAAYVIWSLMFSIQRYAITLEILAGPAIVLILHRLLPLYGSIIASAALAATIVAWSVPSNWGRKPWSAPYFVKIPDAVATTPALFFVLDLPTGYLARHLPRGSRFFSLASGAVLPLPAGQKHDSRIREALKVATPDMLWAIKNLGPTSNADRLALYGLGISKDRPCHMIQGPEVNVEFCPLDRTEKDR